MKQEENERRKTSEEAAGTVERETHTRKSGYLIYRNNDWKGRELADLMEKMNVYF